MMGIVIEPNIINVIVEPKEVGVVITGARGVNGLSAYEVAVNNGFVGDEEAWLASLVGEQGVQGEQGIQGIQGIQGETGADGNVWRNGVGAPSNELGLNDDYYLDTSSGDVYKKISNTYSIEGNIKGTSGDNGTKSMYIRGYYNFGFNLLENIIIYGLPVGVNALIEFDTIKFRNNENEDYPIIDQVIYYNNICAYKNIGVGRYVVHLDGASDIRFEFFGGEDVDDFNFEIIYIPI